MKLFFLQGEDGNAGKGVVKREDEPPQLGLRDPEGSYGAPKNDKPQAVNLTQATRDAAKTADNKASRASEKLTSGADQAASEPGKAGEWAQEKAGKATEAVQDGAEKTKASFYIRPVAAIFMTRKLWGADELTGSSHERESFINLSAKMEGSSQGNPKST